MLKDIDIKDALKYKKAVIKLDKGEVELELYPEEAPIAVCNFATLAKQGFYDGLSFHRVIKGFVAQGGCPDGSGRGGPGYSIKCECKGQKHKHIRGALSMAHAGPDTGGSQFFLVFDAQPHLDGLHTVFGGIERRDFKSFRAMDSIKQGDVMKSIEIVEGEAGKAAGAKAAEKSASGTSKSAAKATGKGAGATSKGALKSAAKSTPKTSKTASKTSKTASKTSKTPKKN